jgi:succinyl-CoA synthetase beta subunit
VDALVDCICHISEFAARHAERVEVIEVNPVRVLPAGSGAIALDAVVELTDAGTPMQLQRRTAT